MNATGQQDALERRLRTTLHTVAGTVVDDRPATAPRQSRRPRLRIALGVGAVAVPLTLAAAAVVRTGPAYVDTIPRERIVATGSVDGSRYLLVESARTDECGEPVTGVELVEERENLLGSEWDTSGYEYGEPVERRCDGALHHVNDTSRYLADPALYDGSGTEVGDSFVWVYAVHPDVDTVRVTSGDYSEDLEVFEVDHAGYALFEIPDGLGEYTSVLLVDGRVVPGSEKVREAPSGDR